MDSIHHTAVVRGGSRLNEAGLASRQDSLNVRASKGAPQDTEEVMCQLPAPKHALQVSDTPTQLAASRRLWNLLR